MKTFDLSEYGNSMFSLTFQSACYVSDKFFAEGDNAFVDDIMISNTTGISSRSDQAGVLTYPNPVANVLNFSANGTGSEITVKILNMQGQTLLKEFINGYQSGDIRQISTSELTSGMYILQITGSEGSVVKKFLVR
jgi:hypothetical protein